MWCMAPDASVSVHGGIQGETDAGQMDYLKILKSNEVTSQLELKFST